MHNTFRTSHDTVKHGDSATYTDSVSTFTSLNEIEKSEPDHTINNGRVVHEKMNGKLFMTLTCMSFIWVGSQIPLYLFGPILPVIYQDIGGMDRWVWFIIAYLIPNAAICPFAGVFSDLFGRQKVAIVGQSFLIIGPIITATANTMNIAIAGSAISGTGAGLNELIALAGTGELVPGKDRAKYVGLVTITILPFCPSVIYAQLIAQASSWRYIGIIVCSWNFIGLLLCIFCYKDPSRLTKDYTARHVLRQVDYIGGILSTTGFTCFMMGLQWGASQYEWLSVHNIAPLILGVVLIIAFLVWEVHAPYPMVPRAIFSKAKRTMIVILLITFFSGGNFFVLLRFWPTELYNVYGDNSIQVGLHSLPIGFGIVLGAVLCFLLIPYAKSHIQAIIIVCSAIMTAFTGAIAIATPNNMSTMYAIVTIASVGCGAVLIPCSIIAQLACPDELIATVTAISLSLRYVGGLIAFALYSNLFYHRVEVNLTEILAKQTLTLGTIINPFTPAGLVTIKHVTELMGNARFEEVKHILATSAQVVQRNAYPKIVAASQEAFAQSYQMPYYVSIAFGGACFILSFCIGDIGPLLTPQIEAQI